MLYFFIAFISTCDFSLKLIGTEHYFGVSPVSIIPTIVSRSLAAILTTEQKSEGSSELLLHVNGRNKVLDYEGNGKRVIIYPAHGMKNQIFEIKLDHSGAYRLINQGMCMQYDLPTSSFMKAICTNEPNQLFNMIDPHETFEVNKALGCKATILYGRFYNREVRNNLNCQPESYSRSFKYRNEKPSNSWKNGNYIATFPESGSYSQLFNIRYIPAHKFKIMSYGMCLEYDFKCDCVMRKECSNKNLQYYEVEPTEIFGFELPDKYKGRPIIYYSSLSYLKSS
ncbi:hypothetical protein CWI37_0016p0030 [Hamiltosporidium tvaerminnensis]|uniref:Ricin B lectin domain-containing protein n=1 Tax=Hamiltosporidium tvaerminnensis TaxID=1176355 RepID=A0A4Q9LDA5_9MICR|nr:hypothetical protein CWI37_0016p0030 [Hamiltosporidium tvaerminnensis]